VALHSFERCITFVILLFVKKVVLFLLISATGCGNKSMQQNFFVLTFLILFPLCHNLQTHKF